MASRRIVTETDLQRLAQQAREGQLDETGMASSPGRRVLQKVPDQYTEALTKLIPPEIVAAFLAIDGIVRGSKNVSINAYWITCGVLVGLCFWWVKRISDASGLPPAWRQIFVSTAAFCVWIYAIGGPFEYGQVAYNASLGGIVAILFTLAAPLILRSKP